MVLEHKPSEWAGVEQETGSGCVPTDFTREPPVASPSLIPLTDSPFLSAQLFPEPSVAEKGPESSPSDRNCASSPAAATDTANYDQLSYGQLRELR